MSRTFRELLGKIHNLPMNEQHEILLQKHLEWRGERYSQVDDILVIGFKI